MRKTLLIVSFLHAACGDDGSAVPVVEILDVTPAQVDPATDTTDDVTFHVDYRDADADLGGGFVEVHDCRAVDLVTRLEIPAIATMEAIDADVPIEGTLTIVVADVGIVAHDAAAPELCDLAGVAAPPAGETTFCVRLIDSAMHEGPPDCTAPVAIVGD